MGFGNGYVVGWGTLALVNAGLAQGKGRSGFIWFLASLALGPIATLAIVALDKVDASVPARTPLAPWVQALVGSLVLAALVLALIGHR